MRYYLQLSASRNKNITRGKKHNKNLAAWKSPGMNDCISLLVDVGSELFRATDAVLGRAYLTGTFLHLLCDQQLLSLTKTSHRKL